MKSKSRSKSNRLKPVVVAEEDIIVEKSPSNYYGGYRADYIAYIFLFIMIIAFSFALSFRAWPTNETPKPPPKVQKEYKRQEKAIVVVGTTVMTLVFLSVAVVSMALWGPRSIKNAMGQALYQLIFLPSRILSSFTWGNILYYGFFILMIGYVGYTVMDIGVRVYNEYSKDDVFFSLMIGLIILTTIYLVARHLGAVGRAMLLIGAVTIVFMFLGKPNDFKLTVLNTFLTIAIISVIVAAFAGMKNSLYVFLGMLVIGLASVTLSDSVRKV